MDGKSISEASSFGSRVLGVVVFLVVAWLVAGWIRTLVLRASDRARVDPTLSGFFANLARYTVLVLSGLGCLSAFGIETTSFAAVLGAASFAVGMALQGSLGNFAAGVMLLLFRPFKVGDVVTTAGQTGKVAEIEIFVTRLITPDNRLIIIPNSKVFGSVIENVTAHDTRRVDVEVGVDYAADIDATRAVLDRAAASVEGILETPDHAIVLTGLGASSVDWVVRVWVRTEDYFAVKEAVTRAIKVELDKDSIGIPYPQMDLHLDAPVVSALRAKG